jgi:hypothetical protein
MDTSELEAASTWPPPRAHLPMHRCRLSELLEQR